MFALYFVARKTPSLSVANRVRQIFGASYVAYNLLLINTFSDCISFDICFRRSYL